MDNAPQKATSLEIAARKFQPHSRRHQRRDRPTSGNNLLLAPLRYTIDLLPTLAACFVMPTVALAAGRQRIGLWHPDYPNAIMLSAMQQNRTLPWA